MKEHCPGVDVNDRPCASSPYQSGAISNLRLCNICQSFPGGRWKTARMIRLLGVGAAMPSMFAGTTQGQSKTLLFADTFMDRTEKHVQSATIPHTVHILLPRTSTVFWPFSPFILFMFPHVLWTKKVPSNFLGFFATLRMGSFSCT